MLDVATATTFAAVVSLIYDFNASRSTAIKGDDLKAFMECLTVRDHDLATAVQQNTQTAISIKALLHLDRQALTEIDADKTLALRRYLFGFALASAADPGVWDLREGCILVRESKTDENKKVVVDPTAFTAVKVKHSGEENAFAPPTNGAAKSYLEAAAKAFFGESTFPAALTLVFDPTGAKAAVSTKSGANSGERKKKGEDLAVLDATDAEPPANTVRWQPAPRGVSLEVPEAGCLDVCDAVFAQDLNNLPMAAAGVRAVTYSSDVAMPALDVPTFVLGLWRNGKRCSWDARLLRQVVGPIRHLLDEIRAEVVDLLARTPSERPAMEELVRRVLVGHDESDNPITESHFAILPLPSVLGPYPDGRVRRVALTDFGHGDDPNRRAIVELAQVLLHGRELRDNGRGTGVVLDTEPDGQWLRAITKRSRTWATVTPLVQTAKELTSSEWKRLVDARRNAEQDPSTVARLEARLRSRRLELIERSVRQAITGQQARIESIEFASGGPIAGVHVATQYRTNSYLGETPKLHVRVTFDRPVVGPIAIGRGRHVGFGLLWPDHVRL